VLEEPAAQFFGAGINSEAVGYQIYIYIYIYMCVCVCVCVISYENTRRITSENYVQSKNAVLILMDVIVTGNRETRCLASLLTLDRYVRYECILLIHNNRAVFMN
jgi:hypothetical protein